MDYGSSAPRSRRSGGRLVVENAGAGELGITLHARNSQYDLLLDGANRHYGTAGAAVHMVDVSGRNCRNSTVQD